MADKKPPIITEQEIVESINEWPVIPLEQEQDSALTSRSIERSDHPQSISRFFLRNIGRPKAKSPSKVERNSQLPVPTADYEKEPLVDVALAKWWRKEGRMLVESSQVPESANPNTIISFVSSTDPGSEFIKNGIRRLRDKVAGGNREWDVQSALASYYEKAGSLSPAKMHLEAAVEKAPNDKELKWRLRRLERMIRCRRQQEKVLRGMDFNQSSQLTLPETKQVTRVSAYDLSFQEFFENYAVRGIPVIIQDLVPQMTSVPWTLQHIVDVAGECTATLKRRVKNSVQWAQLEDSQTMKIKDYVKTIQDCSNSSNELYLFDWSIPCNCPDLAQELIIPKYFAGDFLQRTMEGSLYKDSWPSIFIASQGLTSELHVDTFGSNFWMALFEGKKRWIFYDKTELFKLYPTYKNPWSTDPCFEVDLQNPDLSENPLLSVTQPIECTLEAGEVLFVPAGCPHRVENLEQSLAISGNYVDLSNFNLVQQELAMAGLLDERTGELYKQLSDRDFPSNMCNSIGHLPWQKFKNWSKESYDKYSITHDFLKEKILMDTVA